jgi:DNA replication protein DnaC
MKKSIQVGLLLMNDGLVKSKFRTKRMLPGIRSISDKQKQKARSEISSVLRKWREEQFLSPSFEELTEHCLKVGLDTQRWGKLKSQENPFCLVLMPQIGGDPHLVVVDENEWKRNMGEELEESDILIVPKNDSDLSPQVLQPEVDPLGINPPFSVAQMELLKRTREIKESMNSILSGTLTGNGNYRHLILSGPAGLGKTHLIRTFFEMHAVPNVRITGAVSLFSLGIRLAVIMRNRDPNETLFIHIDDADVAFRTEEGCNLLKQMLIDDKAFVYEKNIGPLLLSFPAEVREAVESFRSEGSFGFRVPLSNVVFIITTNIPYPADTEVRRHLGRNGHSGILVHRNAIRSRCRYRSLDFNNEQRWAWIADVFMENGQIRAENNFVIKNMLDFLWEYRAVAQEHTIRAAEIMLKIAEEKPTTYIKEWKNEFLWNLN